MHGPANNRLHGYEAGWLTLLIEMRVATRREAQEAQSRVAQAAIARMEARREKRRARRGRKEPRHPLLWGSVFRGRVQSLTLSHCRRHESCQRID